MDKTPSRREFLTTGIGYLAGSAVWAASTYAAVDELRSETGELVLGNLIPTLSGKPDTKDVLRLWAGMSAFASIGFGAIWSWALLLAMRAKSPAPEPVVASTSVDPVTTVLPVSATGRPRLRLAYDADQDISRQ